MFSNKRHLSAGSADELEHLCPICGSQFRPPGKIHNILQILRHFLPPDDSLPATVSIIQLPGRLYGMTVLFQLILDGTDDTSAHFFISTVEFLRQGHP